MMDSVKSVFEFNPVDMPVLNIKCVSTSNFYSKYYVRCGWGGGGLPHAFPVRIGGRRCWLRHHAPAPPTHPAYPQVMVLAPPALMSYFSMCAVYGGNYLRGQGKKIGVLPWVRVDWGE